MITRNRKAVLARGGTQSNEYAAAIKSVTSATTVGAVFIYDTSQDSDGGAWRKKCKGLSWFDEAASATRSARSEFPAMALIVADNVSTNNETLTAYDLDDPAMPMWMVFQSAGSLTWSTGGAVTIGSIFALNGRLYVGHNDALIEYDFASDDSRVGHTSAYTLTSGRTIADRNAASSYATGGDGYLLVNYVINDVAATVLEGAEIGALGLPIPTVAVATNGGVSVIHPSGDVYDASPTTTYEGVGFVDGGRLIVARDNSGSSIVYIYNPNYYADAFADKTVLVEQAHGSASSYPCNFIGSGPKLEATNKYDFAVGTDEGLTSYKYNLGKPTDSAFAYITSAYNTGYMVGDIRGAWLANSLTADRSVKANTLTQNGTVPYTAGLGVSADLTAIGPFSASNYLSRAYDADFDFADGDFSISLWYKGAVSGSEVLVSRATASTATHRWYAYLAADETLVFSTHGSSGVSITSAVTPSSEWTQAVFVRRSDKLYIYVNGVVDPATPVISTVNVDSGTAAALGIGTDAYSLGSTPYTGSLSLLRISATAPTPKQIADIYSEERKLFAANAKCLLAANQVNDLAYDKTSGLLHVASESTASSKSFRGLEAVESLTSDGSLGLTAATEVDGITAAGGVLAAYDNAKVGVNLPALDVRAELNEGEDKLPDDGKLHFSGVTTDATATNIGIIPLEINERYTVTAQIIGEEYNADTSNWMSCETIRTYQRDYGSLSTQTVSYKLTDESLASMDAALSADSNNILVRVTGKAATRMVWKASVEVQRISDKTYER